MNLRCQVCDAGTDAYLCKACAEEVRRAVGGTASLMHELSVVATKQARVYRAATPHPRDRERWDDEERDIPAWLRSRDGRVALPATALMVNLDAQELMFILLNTLYAWAEHLCAPGVYLVDELDKIRAAAV